MLRDNITKNCDDMRFTANVGFFCPVIDKALKINFMTFLSIVTKNRSQSQHHLKQGETGTSKSYHHQLLVRLTSD